MKKSRTPKSQSTAASISTSQDTAKQRVQIGGVSVAHPPIYADSPWVFKLYTREPGGLLTRRGVMMEMRRIPIPHEGFSLQIELREEPDIVRVYVSGTIIDAVEWPLIRGPIWQMVKRFRDDPRPVVLLYASIDTVYTAVQLDTITPSLRGRLVSFGEAMGERDSLWSGTIKRSTSSGSPRGGSA